MRQVGSRFTRAATDPAGRRQFHQGGSVDAAAGPPGWQQVQGGRRLTRAATGSAGRRQFHQGGSVDTAASPRAAQAHQGGDRSGRSSAGRPQQQAVSTSRFSGQPWLRWDVIRNCTSGCRCRMSYRPRSEALLRSTPCWQRRSVGSPAGAFGSPSSTSFRKLALATQGVGRRLQSWETDAEVDMM